MIEQSNDKQVYNIRVGITVIVLMDNALAVEGSISAHSNHLYQTPDTELKPTWAVECGTYLLFIMGIDPPTRTRKKETLYKIEQLTFQQ